jgi:hypothetical protein
MLTWLDIIPRDISEYIYSLVRIRDKQELILKEVITSQHVKKIYYDFAHSTSSDFEFFNVKPAIIGHITYNTIDILIRNINSLVRNVQSLKSDMKSDMIYINSTTCLDNNDKQQFISEFNNEIYFSQSYLYSIIKTLSNDFNYNYKNTLMEYVIKSYLQIL